MKIKIHNLSNLKTCDFTDFVELQRDFKIRSQEHIEKLANRIIETGFKYPYFTWINENTKYIIDAHGRTAALEYLQSQGYEIPKVPYIEIFAKSKAEAEAEKEILYLNSNYGTIDKNSDFFQKVYVPDMDVNFSLPEIKVNEKIINEIAKKTNDFKSEFDKYNDDNCEMPIVPEFFENHECFLIPVHNGIDEQFIRDIFGLNQNHISDSGDKKVRKTNVISIEKLKEWQMK